MESPGVKGSGVKLRGSGDRSPPAGGDANGWLLTAGRLMDADPPSNLWTGVES